MAEIVQMPKNRSAKSKRQPFAMEFHIGGLDGAVQIKSVEPFVLEAHVTKGRSELLHAELRIKPVEIEGGGLSEVFAHPSVRKTLADGLGRLAAVLNLPVEPMPSGSLADAPGTFDREASKARLQRAADAATAAARAKAEELGVLEVWERTQEVQRAGSEAYNAAYNADRSEGTANA